MMYYLRWLIFRRFRVAAELRHNAKKLLNHQRDLMTEEGIAALQNEIDTLRRVMHSAYNREKLDEATEKLQQVGTHRLIPYKSPGIRENIEVALFAVGIAMGIRTFFFQPMGIPTGSMQPTLYGITEARMNQNEPITTGISAYFNSWLNGISYHHLKSEGYWELIDIEPSRSHLLLFKRQKLTFEDTKTGEIIVKDISPPIGSRGNSVLLLANPFTNQLTTEPNPKFINNSHLNYQYSPGEDVFKVRRESGDHLLVNRFTYNFRKPRRGEIIVFDTQSITNIAKNQFYIKRLVGLPNEKLTISTNFHVSINDRELNSTVHPFEFIYSFDLIGPITESTDSQYSGHEPKPYTNTITNIPPNRYYALGDNTRSSSDSRDWGTLPGKNIFGTPSFIYWPFFEQPSRTRPHRFGWAFQ